MAGIEVGLGDRVGRGAAVMLAGAERRAVAGVQSGC